MAPTRVILMSCGSYNPPTNMHLRMFEIARDHLHRMGTHIVVGAVISPTHDDYPKKELASAEHRCAMLKLATENSDWIRVSTWEARQNGWTKTRLSLQHHQNLLNAVLLDSNDSKYRSDTEDTNWIPENVKNSSDRTPIQIKLLCGADLLESFGTPGLWADEDIDAIVGQHGLVVITREGSNPNKFIYDSDILSKYMHNIHIVTEWIPNEVSSTKIRRALKRAESVRYLVQDSVIEYIYKHGIYDAKTVSIIKLELSTKNDNDFLCIQPKYESTFLTPSPSDVTMTTPSPVEIISIDISESVLKKNFHNTPMNGRTILTSSTSDDNERIRDKFNNAITENVNRVLGCNKVSYPGQAKQIIANESGESQIFCEVGLNCIRENYKIEMEIDGKVDHVVAKDDSPSNSKCKIDAKEAENDGAILSEELAIISDALEVLKSSEQELTPDDSDSKISVILSIDVVDSSTLENKHKRSKDESADQEIPFEKNSNEIEDNGAVSTVSCDDEITITTSCKDRDDKEEEKSETIVESPRIYGANEAAENFAPPTDNVQDQPEIDFPIERIEKKPVEKSSKSMDERDSSNRGSTIEELSQKHESNIEIDGKYIKSVVNSRKSPKKLKNEDILAVTSDDSKSSGEKSNGEIQSKKSSIERINTVGTGRKRGVVFQGSLDSINVKQPKSSSIINSQNHPAISKKSKSYESIKPTEIQPTLIYNISLDGSKDENVASSCDDTSKLRTDSMSIFTTANEPQESGQTDEFCSVCCYANEPSSTDAFYTLRSTGSSPLEEASTECDICSNCDLREDPEEETPKFEKPILPGEPVCELCEICGDAAMDEDVVASSRPEKDDFVDRRLSSSRPLPLSLPKRNKGVVRLNTRTFNNIENDDEEDDEDDDADRFDIEASEMNRKVLDSRDKVQALLEKAVDRNSTDDTNSNDDEFEIENCGLDAELDRDLGNEENSRYRNEVEDTLRNIVPRDEIAISAKNSKKMTRTGSLVNRDTIDRTRAKRRYSSVDNLQNSRQIVKSTIEKPNSLRPRGVGRGIVGSADNIRPTRSSRSRTTLRKSADDVARGYHSPLDDTHESPLYENIGRKKFGKEQKPRDSGTIKMILTKHGIKIISDKETAL
ncbi:uncharacterized protein Nmnat [Venturia canescens]|uniref:uncharacterized protein Nmnat n=1 Tax=Venturia canescens TaxID=32260 RepID=UPI001C9C074A|nr:uncharacterized protein LOC122406646 [Venturia canescens]